MKQAASPDLPHTKDRIAAESGDPPATDLETLPTARSVHPSWSAVTRRETLLTMGVLPGGRNGLEIGPSDNPVIPPAFGMCRYVDYTWSNSRSLAGKVEGQVFDFAIASHVMERVPNPIGWINGIYEVLKPGSRFNLSVSDRRFNFDVWCPESTVGQMVEAHLMKYERPSARQVFDSCFYGKAIDAGARWAREIDASMVPALTGDIAPQLSFDQARETLNGKYIDSHCWVFTPQSFIRAMKGICQVGVMPFEFADFHPTIDGDFEFFVSLRKPETRLFEQDLMDRQLGQLSYFGRVWEDRRRRLRMLAE